MPSARVMLIVFESAVFDGAAQKGLIDEFFFTFIHFRDVSVTGHVGSHHSHAQWKHYRHKLYKMRNRRILTAHCMAISRYTSHSCTRSHFCCGLLEVGSTTSAFHLSLCVSIGNFKIMMPYNDIPREHYRQRCQYRLWGLRYIERGLASSMIHCLRRQSIVAQMRHLPPILLDTTVVDCVLEWCRAKRWRHLLDFACFVEVRSSGGLQRNHGAE